MSRAPLCLLLLALVPVPPAQAQVDRFELGQHLRAFERVLAGHPEAPGRRRALAPLEQASFAFFTAQPGEAARQLDLARLALTAPSPAPEFVWASAFATRPQSCLLDPAGDLPLTLSPFYRPEGKGPEKPAVRWTLLGADGKPANEPVLGDWTGSRATRRLSLRDLREGDYLLRTEILSGGPAGGVLGSFDQTVSVAGEPRKRLQALRQARDALPAKPLTTDRATLDHLIGTLDKLSDGQTLETNYPAARLLAEAEALLADLRAGKQRYGASRPGEFWLALAAGKRPAPVRVLVPESVRRGKPVPLVVALHGAGGSENLFFDGYGDGLIARLCAKRGWLLVAVRDDLQAGLLDELARLYPVDDRRVFLVGHSLGAARALTAVGRAPTRWAGVAVLGGSGGLVLSEDLKPVPFFVGVGQEDFALAGARSLHKTLVRGGVRKAELHVYPDVEHLMVVQLALPEVFAFFDAAR